MFSVSGCIPITMIICNPKNTLSYLHSCQTNLHISIFNNHDYTRVIKFFCQIRKEKGKPTIFSIFHMPIKFTTRFEQTPRMRYHKCLRNFHSPRFPTAAIYLHNIHLIMHTCHNDYEVYTRIISSLQM